MWDEHLGQGSRAGVLGSGVFFAAVDEVIFRPHANPQRQTQVHLLIGLLGEHLGYRVVAGWPFADHSRGYDCAQPPSFERPRMP
jgi:hypothetical protein